mgnify:CR=1 FL=1
MVALKRNLPGQAEESEDQKFQYYKAGKNKALNLGNRGPIKFNPDGSLAKQILDAYSEFGFYVFEDVISTAEIKDLENGVASILKRLPVSEDSTIDSSGNPAIGTNCEAPTLFWSKPLGDPFGGTTLANGRHPVKMNEPQPSKNSPEKIVYLILGTLQFSDELVRTYAHPELLKVAEQINGEDFVPFTDALFIKEPGMGASVAWHRDGTTHWDSANFDERTHGFNFMIQLYGCTEENGVWVVPGTHKKRYVDIAKMVSDAGSERVEDAVPMICNPGDVVISNRQVVHGSFANTSSDWRITINQGFHRRKSVLGVKGGGLHGEPAVYDTERIIERSKVIKLAIEARKQRFPDEEAFEYKPLSTSTEDFTWNAAAKRSLHDYNLLDLSI